MAQNSTPSYMSSDHSLVPAAQLGPAVFSAASGLHADPQPELELPEKLPSHLYRYSQWHDLRDNEVTGDQLHAPRIRNGPEKKEKLFYSLSDETNERIHHGFKGRKRLNYRNHTENWEQVEVANLSYQEMQHEYQAQELRRVVSRLGSAREVLLMEDEVRDISAVSLPACRALNLSRNYIERFASLPYAPVLEYLNLSDNNVDRLDGLRRALPVSLKVLDLRGNPVAFLPFYRQRVFRLLPNLLDLDGVVRHSADDDEIPAKFCREDDRLGCTIL